MFITYAHRGASEYAPENTLSSFYLGLSMGANGIETDVQRTKDGILVLFHDDTLDRVTGVSGKIGDYTYAELAKFRVKNAKTGKEDIITTMEDFLRYFGFRDLTFAIELKEAGTEADVLTLLDKYAMREKTVITSFNFSCIETVKKLRPDYKVGWLAVEFDDEKLAKAVIELFDMRPAAMIENLGLRAPIYQQTAAYGHMGRPDLDLPWERLDKVDALKEILC